jgi:hypothetical protein
LSGGLAPTELAILIDAPPSKDLPLLVGRSSTLKDEEEEESGGLCTSSKALPEDFLL